MENAHWGPSHLSLHTHACLHASTSTCKDSHPSVGTPACKQAPPLHRCTLTAQARSIGTPGRSHMRAHTLVRKSPFCARARAHTHVHRNLDKWTNVWPDASSGAVRYAGSHNQGAHTLLQPVVRQPSPPSPAMTSTPLHNVLGACSPLRQAPTQEQTGTPSPTPACTPCPCPRPAAHPGIPGGCPTVTPPTALTASPGPLLTPPRPPSLLSLPGSFFPCHPCSAVWGWHGPKLRACREGTGEGAGGSRSWRRRRHFLHCFSRFSPSRQNPTLPFKMWKKLALEPN